MIGAPLQTRRRKKTGAARIFAAAGYSLAGFRRLMQEPAFRQELVVGVIVLIGLALIQAPAHHILGATLLLLALLATEALNTAIEYVVDHLSPEISDFARHAKDIGSFAVFCMLCANALFIGYILIQAVIYS